MRRRATCVMPYLLPDTSRESRVSTTMISKPRDFVHVTKMDKTDAARIRDSKVSWPVHASDLVQWHTADTLARRRWLRSALLSE